MPDLSEHILWPELACMHLMCLCARAHISAKLGQIRKIKVSMESWEQAHPFWAQTSSQASKLSCMHTICLHALAHISAKLGLIRKMKVSLELEDHTRPIWVHNTTQARKLCACMLCACLHRPISQPNWNGSERSKYLWNQENRPNLSEHILQAEHAS